ncbi:MAG: DNA recombination/repair protein RecA, partial [Clostridiales bacterium]|nr:DNA recombination/repair protein RecA [Clostridiales bacterium]
GEQLKNGTEVIGNRTRVKVVKNKVAPPFRMAEFDLLYGYGMSKEGTILDMAVARDLIQKAGSWFSYKDIRIGQGRDNARKYLQDNQDIMMDLEALIRAEFATTPTHAEADDESSDMED